MDVQYIFGAPGTGKSCLLIHELLGLLDRYYVLYISPIKLSYNVPGIFQLPVKMSVHQFGGFSGTMDMAPVEELIKLHPDRKWVLAFDETNCTLPRIPDGIEIIYIVLQSMTLLRDITLPRTRHLRCTNTNLHSATRLSHLVPLTMLPLIAQLFSRGPFPSPTLPSYHELLSMLEDPALLRYTPLIHSLIAPNNATRK